MQRDIFESAKTLRDEASLAHEAWKKYREESDEEYGREAVERFKRVERLNEETYDLVERVKRSEVEVTDDPKDLTGLQVSPDSPQQAMREIEYNMRRGEKPDSVYLEPAEMAKEDFSSLYLEVISDPMYRDLERQIEHEELKDRYEDLQHDINKSAEKLTFVTSEMEEVIERADDYNLESAVEHLEDLLSVAHRYFRNTLGTVREASRYREEYNLKERSNLMDSQGEIDINQESEPGVKDVDLEPAYRSMDEFHDTIADLELLELEPDPVESLDDAEEIE